MTIDHTLVFAKFCLVTTDKKYTARPADCTLVFAGNSFCGNKKQSTERLDDRTL